MNNLTKIKLGDYIDIITDYHSSGSYETLKEHTKILYSPSYAVMIRTLNFENNDFAKNLIYCDKESYDFLEGSHVKYNDVLMNKISNPGSVYIMPKVPYRVTCGMNLFLIRFKNINQRYIYYLMKYNENYIKSKTHGTTTKTITKDDVRGLCFFINNSKDEQDKIERLLTTIDEKIELNNKINTELEAIARELYEYWFIQFDFPNENGRPYKSSKGKMVWNEELKREIPEGWNVKKLGELIVENKKSPLKVSDAKGVGNYPFFTSGEEILLHNESQIDGLNCYMNTGGNGDIKVYNGEAAYSTDTWSIRGKDNSTAYLSQILLSFRPRLDIKFFAGTGLQHLQKDLLKMENIVMPHKNILDKFNEDIETITLKIANNKKQNRDLAELRDFLLPMLMNGQVTVRYIFVKKGFDNKNKMIIPIK